MKKFPTFVITAAATFTFILTYSALSAASDDQGIEHWMAQETSAIAAIAAGSE
jgi:hypothetical protein